MKQRQPRAFIVSMVYVMVIGILASYMLEAKADDRKPLQEIHKDTLSLYTPIAQPVGDVFVEHSGEVPFTGDCDDYYSAAYNQMYAYGYTPFALILTKTGQVGHIVACTEVNGITVCLDNNAKRTVSMHDIRRTYRGFKSEFRGRK